jgi:endonuclease/exonuclease/phosphatase family metal-dependent hydrolase
MMNLTLATVNVLYEMYYVHYAEPHTALTTIGWRINAFKKALENPQALAGCDIICFQEWPYTDYQVHAHKNEPVIIHGKSVTKGSYFPLAVARQHTEFNALVREYYSESDYYYCQDEHSKNGVLTIIAKSCGQLEEYGFQTLEGNKEFGYALMNVAGKRILIINAHLPFFDNETHIKTIERFADGNSVAAVIVAGDFNYNIWDKERQAINLKRLNRFKELWKGYELSADMLPHPTALAASGKALNLVDFFLIKGAIFSSQKLSIFPLFNQAEGCGLVSHRAQVPPERGYFSDHAILRLILRLGSGTNS